MVDSYVPWERPLPILSVLRRKSPRLFLAETFLVASEAAVYHAFFEEQPSH